MVAKKRKPNYLAKATLEHNIADDALNMLDEMVHYMRCQSDCEHPLTIADNGTVSVGSDCTCGLEDLWNKIESIWSVARKYHKRTSRAEPQPIVPTKKSKWQ